jgi:hypothetical protein
MCFVLFGGITKNRNQSDLVLTYFSTHESSTTHGSKLFNFLYTCWHHPASPLATVARLVHSKQSVKTTMAGFQRMLSYHVHVAHKDPSDLSPTSTPPTHGNCFTFHHYTQDDTRASVIALSICFPEVKAESDVTCCRFLARQYCGDREVLKLHTQFTFSHSTQRKCALAPQKQERMTVTSYMLPFVC